MEDCLAPRVPKIEKANGAKGPLIPRKESRSGLWRKRQTGDTKTTREVSHIPCGLHGSC